MRDRNRLKESWRDPGERHEDFELILYLQNTLVFIRRREKLTGLSNTVKELQFLKFLCGEKHRPLTQTHKLTKIRTKVCHLPSFHIFLLS